MNEIDYILLDPSCSGSGIRNRSDASEPVDEERLERLATLQIRMVTFALTQFPRVKRVTYSTCSIHSQENEQVVETVLDQCGETFQVGNATSESHYPCVLCSVGRFPSSMAQSRTNGENSSVPTRLARGHVDQWILCCLF